MKVKLSKDVLKWIWYWVSCYQCPEYPQCEDDKPCENCKAYEKTVRELEDCFK